MQWNGMISVPSVEHRLLHLPGYVSSLVVRGLGVMSLSSSMGVQWLEVYHTPGFAIRLPHNHHALAPSVRGTDGDLLYDSEADVAVQVLLHLAFPVHRHGSCLVSHDRCGLWVNVKSQRGTGHHGEWLVAASVERQSFEDCTQVLFQDAPVSFCGWHR